MEALTRRFRRSFGICGSAWNSCASLERLLKPPSPYKGAGCICNAGSDCVWGFQEISRVASCPVGLSAIGDIPTVPQIDSDTVDAAWYRFMLMGVRD